MWGKSAFWCLNSKVSSSKEIMELNRSKDYLKASPAGNSKEVDFNQEVILAELFKESAQKGFELMFKYYYAPLCSNAIRVLYDKQAAEDIVSDVFVDFWENIFKIEIKTSYRSYLYQAVRNRALNYLKRQVSKDFLTSGINEDALELEVHTKPEDIISYQELSKKLEVVIGELPKQSKRAFQMHRIDGKKYTEIAQELKISVSAVERLIGRALKKIRDSIVSEFDVLIISTILLY